jgi:Superfamily II DNA/RNA helicases, SNF2 family
MSFLAQLRQKQNPVVTGGLQLCYLLTWQDDGLYLAMHLAHLENGRVRELEQAYAAQQAHLNQPPSFTIPADIAVLRHLLAGDWNGRAAGFCRGADMAFLRLLLATEKCFFSLADKALSWSEPCAVQPVWRISAAGAQSLSWRHASAGRFWSLAGGDIGVVVEGNQLRPCQSGLTQEALAEVGSAGVLQPESLAEFMQATAPRWRALGLPLPTELPSTTVAANLRPVLVCESAAQADGRWLDALTLAFRYESDAICFTRRFADAGAASSFWNGERLLAVAHRAADELAAYQRVADYLQTYLQGLVAQGSSRGSWRPQDKAAWQALLLEHRAALEAEVDFHFAPGFRHAYIAPANWTVAVEQGEADWRVALALEAQGERYELLDLLEQLRLFNRMQLEGLVELQVEGRILVLPGGLMRSLAAELEDLVDWYGGSGRIPLSQLYRLEGLRHLLPGGATEWSGDDALLRRSHELQMSPALLDSTASGVQAELRPYQWLGVCWLQHLKQLGFNGLLADDMGLGKTLQTLAHLSLEHKHGVLQRPALIVAPTSLLPNWAKEIRRFCPHLRAHVVHGGQRHQSWPQSGVHIYITSYHLLVRDLEHWSAQSLSWLVLDEAQMIKNPQTHASRAVRELKAEHRLCLSGTPVENHLGELWALLDFLEPGVLGNQRQFKSHYQKPIEQEGSGERLQQLLTRIAPLMLRRTKNQVARDLPPKTLVQQVIPLGEEQQAFYQRLKQDDWQNLMQQLEGVDNPGQQQMMLLAALIRLRQACCDPRLLSEDVPSAKTEYCLDMLESLVAEGRAVLVFSQFTRMLDILAEGLTQLGIKYLMLTGQSRDRAELVEAFQAGQAPVFLISLKAGGVGLNLTRADTVIHFDPWWNIAAEEQASDRAHRIGQTQPVFVYKLIAENTIEEKIAELQESKALLSQQVNRQAQDSGTAFALKLEDLLRLWQEDESSQQ